MPRQDPALGDLHADLGLGFRRSGVTVLGRYEPGVQGIYADWAQRLHTIIPAPSRNRVRRDLRRHGRPDQGLLQQGVGAWAGVDPGIVATPEPIDDVVLHESDSQR